MDQKVAMIVVKFGDMICRRDSQRAEFESREVTACGEKMYIRLQPVRFDTTSDEGT